MRPEDSEKALRKLLRDQQYQLKSLTARDVLRLATSFWTASPIEGLRPESGDGLVAYFELLNRNGTVYEFGINRVLRPSLIEEAPYRAWLPAWTLRFSICFRPILETFQIKAPVASFSCWDKQDVAHFVAQVSSSAPYIHCLAQPQKSCSIKLYESTSPWGDPDHPTQGHSWAIG